MAAMPSPILQEAITGKGVIDTIRDGDAALAVGRTVALEIWLGRDKSVCSLPSTHKDNENKQLVLAAIVMRGGKSKA